VPWAAILAAIVNARHQMCSLKPKTMTSKCGCRLPQRQVPAARHFQCTSDTFQSSTSFLVLIFLGQPFQRLDERGIIRQFLDADRE
jgi:hypothetical protein